MDKDTTAHLIDNEPVLFLGCSNSEIFSLAFLGAVCGLFFGLTLSIVTGFYFLILPCFFFGPPLVVFKGGQRLGKSKEGMPDGYYGRFIHAYLTKKGFQGLAKILTGKNFVIREGMWSNRR